MEKQKRLKDSLTPEGVCTKLNNEIDRIQNHYLLGNIKKDYPEYSIKPALDHLTVQGNSISLGEKSITLSLNEEGKIHPQDAYRLLLNQDMLHPFIIGFSKDFNIAMINNDFYLKQLDDNQIKKIKEQLATYIQIKAEMPFPKSPKENPHYKKLTENALILDQYLKKFGSTSIQLSFEGDRIEIYDAEKKLIGRISQQFNLGEIYLDESFKIDHPLEKK